MTSPKLYLCNLLVILLAGLAAAASPAEAETNSTAPAVDEGPRGNCSCGGFASSTPEAAQQPLLSQTPGLVVRCADDGNSTCKNLCVALATATKAKGPEILCNKLKDCNDLKLSAFYKICDGPWVYANMTAEEPLCCTAGAPCAREPPASPAAVPVLDAKTPL